MGGWRRKGVGQHGGGWECGAGAGRRKGRKIRRRRKSENVSVGGCVPKCVENGLKSNMCVMMLVQGKSRAVAGCW
jgi:hypothetical protein